MRMIWIKKVAEAYGWMGNMAPYPITVEGKIWRTSEALFQGMRFDDEVIKEIIRKEKSPMAAKMKAKKYSNQMVVVPMSELDVDQMKKCVRMKFDQHPELKKMLLMQLKKPPSFLVLSYLKTYLNLIFKLILNLLEPI
jgi:predicted NAD-dependent protein-ADP-ribosyltransferase YbiA (DUF1768 family)